MSLFCRGVDHYEGKGRPPGPRPKLFRKHKRTRKRVTQNWGTGTNYESGWIKVNQKLSPNVSLWGGLKLGARNSGRATEAYKPGLTGKRALSTQPEAL